ncbi:PREDICTED: uncharacterized protein LOC106818975, partial [Priapulus caudatus]|uniref:Uncharacterized protein LOC106818975 n=1 Tax=Priapulus caudatus TaxID=37621 RepID=A0ABM1F3V6_PRICU
MARSFYERLIRSIFGATSSPACCNFALQQTARDNAANFSEQAVQAILQDVYMDDLLKSVEGVPKGIELAKELVALTAMGGFRLHKWLSNAREVLAAIDSSELAVREVDFDNDEVPNQRTLGMSWDLLQDIFVFHADPKETNMTKRGLVSIMCSVFDPCGYITPFIFRAKCLVQDLWRAGLDWDQPLPDNLQHKWREWLRELRELYDTVKIPRHHPGFSSQAEDVQIHVFGDASESGFGAVAYLRYNVQGVIIVSFLSSKTRVAPLKTLSIPRLELQGSLLAARLGKLLETELKVGIQRHVYWSDSEVVLKYLRNEVKRFKPFVANRVAEIRDLTQPEDWHHVPTDCNPADLCSRGTTVAALDPNSLWFQGPPFLRQ